MQRHGLNMVHDAIIVESDSNHPLSVILMEEGEEDWSNSINAFMLAEGLAVLEKYVLQSQDGEVPESVQSWSEFEDEARNNSTGLWQHGNAAGALEDDEDY